ncbi:MAG: NYN domain-containing protein [Bacteroidota bacterium]
MAQRWLIDGFNALHQMMDQRQLSHDLAGAMNHLLSQLAQQLPGSLKADVIFDGTRPGTITSPTSINVQFSGQQSADDVIVQRIQTTDRSTQWIVFTNDAQLKQRVRKLKAETRSISQLLNAPTTSSPSSSSAQRPPEKDPDVFLTDREAQTLADLWNLRDKLDSDS